MTWPIWNKEETEESPAAPTPRASRSPSISFNAPVHDTVDAFKLEPGNKLRHAGSRSAMLSIRQSRFKFAARFHQLRLKRQPSSLSGPSFEPQSIAEYKRLKYISNRDFYHKQSVCPSSLEKSGIHDKHCVFISITGITIKLGLGRRHPIGHGSGHSWSLKYRDRVPHYASNTSHFSIRMSNAENLFRETKETISHSVDRYMSKAGQMNKDAASGAKLLKRSLELQAQDLYSRFSTSSSLESLNLDGPSLSFVWDDLGLMLEPLSATQTSLYEVLTKDRGKHKEDTSVSKKKQVNTFSHKVMDYNAKDSTEDKPKKKTRRRSPGKDGFSSVGTNGSVLGDSGEEEKKKKKSQDRRSKTFSKKNFLRIPKLSKKNSSPSSEEQSQFSRDSSSACDSPQSTKGKTYSSFEQVMESTIPKYFDKAVLKDTMYSTRSVGEIEAKDHQQRSDLSMPEQAAVKTGPTLARSSKSVTIQKPFLDALELGEKLDLEQNNLYEKPSVLPNASYLSYKSPTSSRRSLESKSPIPSRVSLEYKSLQPTPTFSEKDLYYATSEFRLKKQQTDQSSSLSGTSTSTKSEYAMQPTSLTEAQSEISPHIKSRQPLQPIHRAESPSGISSTIKHQESQTKTAQMQSWYAISRSNQTDSQSGPPSRYISRASFSPSPIGTPANNETVLEEYERIKTLRGVDAEDRFYDCISLEDNKSVLPSADTDRTPRNFFKRLPTSLAQASRFFSQIFGKSDKNEEEQGDEDDSSGACYLSPRSYSQPDLTSIENFRVKSKGKAHGDEDDDSENVYFSPKSYSQPDLANISNSNSVSPVWMLYNELLMTQLELKQLWIENTTLKAQLKHGRAATINTLNLNRPSNGKENK